MGDSAGTMQSLWIGAALPPLQQLSIRSFLAHGHEYRLYAYDDIVGVPAGATVCDASTILGRDSVFCYQSGFGKGSYSAFSNLFRYTLLVERGGWWVDTDVVCLRPYTFDDPYVFATEIDDDLTVNCATCSIRCPAGAPVLGYCAEVVLATDKETLQWGQIGPQLFSAAVKEFELTAYCVPVETFNPINFFEFGELVTPGFDMSRLERSYGVHFWNQMWKSRDADPATAPPPDSLYGILRDRYAPSVTGGLALG